MLNSKISRVIAFSLLSTCVLAGAGYARLLVLSHNTALYYDADELARNLQANFDPKTLQVFSPMFCSEDDNCIEVRALSYASDPAVQDKVTGYVTTMCDGRTSQYALCRKNKAGRLNAVNVYMHEYPSGRCVRKLEINRSTPKSVVTKSCNILK